MKPLSYTITPADEGRRIKQLLRSKLGISQALVKRLRDEDKVRLNGEPVLLTQYAKAGDRLTVDLTFAEETSVIPEPMPLDIIYEDEDFLVLNKPPGILVHPVGPHTTNTLANGVIEYWLRNGIKAKFRPIHRLDRNTSGLVVVGKNQFAHQSLYRQLLERSVQREYLALVEGSFNQEEGTITAPIARKPNSIVERWVHPSGQEAVTHYKVVVSLGKVTLVKLTLETGRTHQIRVHMSYLGHPLLGDDLYGGSTALINRHALHSYRFGFIHPRYNTPIHFQAELVQDMQQLIKVLGGQN